MKLGEGSVSQNDLRKDTVDSLSGVGILWFTLRFHLDSQTNLAPSLSEPLKWLLWAKLRDRELEGIIVSMHATAHHSSYWLCYLASLYQDCCFYTRLSGITFPLKATHLSFLP